MSGPGGSSQDGSFAGGFVPRAGYYQAGLATERWAAFEIGELQQLLAATITATRQQILGDGSGNLLPRLTDELSAALNRAVEHDA